MVRYTNCSDIGNKEHLEFYKVLTPYFLYALHWHNLHSDELYDQQYFNVIS